MNHAMNAATLLVLLLLGSCEALRNVDRCELMLWSASALVGSPSAANELRTGCARLIDEAIAQQTLVGSFGGDVSEPVRAVLPPRFGVLHTGGTVTAPDLIQLRRSLDVTPDGFGGSDGFGSRPQEVERAPLPPYCVCFVTTPAECDAVRRAGMRAVALPSDEGYAVDEELDGFADVCLDALDQFVCADDFSTPGAFWLNPAVARDPDGNRVDLDTGETLAPRPEAVEDEEVADVDDVVDRLGER